MPEHVVLVNEKNEPLGTMPKAEVHGSDTPLHRAFSLFIFNSRGQLLLQQRASSKKTWPLVWSNSCCGHPALHETYKDAARRRTRAELGLGISDVQMILPDYRYRATRDGVVENEICPVMVATSIHMPQPNPTEVEKIRWIRWEDWMQEIHDHSGQYSEWCIEETKLLNVNSKFQSFYRQIRPSVHR